MSITTDRATERAAAQRRWVMLSIVLIVQFMVILEGKCTCVKVGRKLTTGA
jgi:hypothetical protein